MKLSDLQLTSSTFSELQDEQVCADCKLPIEYPTIICRPCYERRWTLPERTCVFCGEEFIDTILWCEDIDGVFGDETLGTSCYAVSMGFPYVDQPVVDDRPGAAVSEEGKEDLPSF